MLLEGTSPKEIAYKLKVSYHTIDFHRNKLYKKLEVSSIQELFAKYGSASPLSSQNLTVESSAAISGNRTERRLKIPAYVGIAVLAIAMFLLGFLIRPFFFKEAGIITFTDPPLIISFEANEPHGYNFLTYLDLEDTIITEGDSYTFYYSFTSNIDFGSIYINFVDRTIEEEHFWSRLSANVLVKSSVFANVEYSGLATFIIRRTASSAETSANLFNIHTTPFTAEQPILTFTRFEVIKN